MLTRKRIRFGITYYVTSCLRYAMRVWFVILIGLYHIFFRQQANPAATLCYALSRSALSYAATQLQMCNPFATSFTRYASLTIPAKQGGKRGVRGEGGEASGSPRRWTARIDFRQRRPWRAPVPHELAGSVRSPSKWMMELPIGFRVSGCFWKKHPIKSTAGVDKNYQLIWAHENRARIMRGDYYVVPPNSARIHMCSACIKGLRRQVCLITYMGDSFQPILTDKSLDLN